MNPFRKRPLAYWRRFIDEAEENEMPEVFGVYSDKQRAKKEK